MLEVVTAGSFKNAVSPVDIIVTTPLLTACAIAVKYKNGCFGLGQISSNMDLSSIVQGITAGVKLNGAVTNCMLFCTRISIAFVEQIALDLKSNREFLANSGFIKVEIEYVDDLDTTVRVTQGGVKTSRVLCDASSNMDEVKQIAVRINASAEPIIYSRGVDVDQTKQPAAKDSTISRMLKQFRAS